MTRFLRHRVAAPAVVLVLAGCGTTVSTTGSGANSLGVQQGGNPSAPSLAGAGATAPGGSLTGAGLTGTTGGGGLTSGSTSGGATTSGGGATTVGSGSVASGQGDGPGVTATTINIGDAYDPDAAAADAALGAANGNPGDTKTETNAVVAYINSHGGVAHRKLNTIWVKTSVQDSADTTSQRMCSAWTEDTKVFLMQAPTQLLMQCAANEHAVAVNTGAIAIGTTRQERQYPQVINESSFTIDHGMLVTINGLARQGYFRKGAKVGVVTWDDPSYHYGIAAGAQPALARIGLRNVPVQYVAVPQSYGDLGATSASAGNAVLKFRAAGIDHVILLDGPAGVNSSGVLVLEWMQQASSQHYYPIHGLNSTSAFNGLASDYPKSEMEHSVGVSWVPALDMTQADYDALPKPAMTKLCLQIMKNAGQSASGANAQAVQLAICEHLFFLKQALDKVTGPLNQQTALAALNGMGGSFRSAITFAVNITAAKHDGAEYVRNMAFQDGCSCYRYTSAAYDPY